MFKAFFTEILKFFIIMKKFFLLVTIKDNQRGINEETLSSG